MSEENNSVKGYDKEAVLAGIDRSGRAGWVKYMTERPHYFTYITRMEPTHENIVAYYRKSIR